MAPLIRGALVVVALAVLAELATPADALTVTTQNVRVTLGPAHARHDIRQAAEGSGLVFTQEMQRRRAAAFRPAGFGSAQAARPRTNNRGDCATFWDRSRWRFVSRRAVQFEFAPFKNGHRWALVTVLRSRVHPRVTLATVNVHSVTRSLDRRAVFRRGTARLGRLGAALAARWGRVVMGGDWNRLWRLRARFAGFHTASPARATGPEGGRVDYVFWHGLTYGGARVIGDTYSDHNGFRVRLWRH